VYVLPFKTKYTGCLVHIGVAANIICEADCNHDRLPFELFGGGPIEGQ
jgi:hypothetical protein